MHVVSITFHSLEVKSLLVINVIINAEMYDK